MSIFKLLKEVTGPLKTNSYLLFEKTKKEGALFDVGGKIPKLISSINKAELRLKYIFFTHLHFDHVQGLEEIRELFPKAKIGFHKSELDIVKNMGMFARMFEFDTTTVEEPEIELDDNQLFTLGELEIKTMLTPGHTPGSICFYFNGSLISGDVLFKLGVGRTDFYGGSQEQLEHSIQRIFKLPDETKVYPGHGENTSIGFEKRNNPFARLVSDI
ncbi:MAG: MBL fold metallo-hydrolase [Candidatus Heimdallarchaeaceae archaeon]